MTAPEVRSLRSRDDGCRDCGTFVYTPAEMRRGRRCAGCHAKKQAEALAEHLGGTELPPKWTARWHDENEVHSHCLACGSCRLEGLPGLCDTCHQRAQRARRRAHRASARRCTVCDGPLWSDPTAATRARSDRTTCSDRCRQRAYRRRRSG